MMAGDGFGRRLLVALADAPCACRAYPESVTGSFGRRLLVALADPSPTFRPLRIEEEAGAPVAAGELFAEQPTQAAQLIMIATEPLLPGDLAAAEQPTSRAGFKIATEPVPPGDLAAVEQPTQAAQLKIVMARPGMAL